MSFIQVELLEEQDEPGFGVDVPADPDPTRHRASSRGALIRRRLLAMPRFWIGGGMVAVLVLWALFGRFTAQWDYTKLNYSAMNQGPSATHWFGTDNLGHDLYAQTVVGLGVSLVIGFIAGPISTLIAAIVGSIAGYVGGAVDRVMAWLIDLFLVLPTFFLLIILYPLTKGNWLAMTGFLAVTAWMIMAQVIRSQTRSLRERDFVKAARYMGFGPWSIVTRHIMPNVASLLIIDAALGIGAVIMSETTLAFFGFGVQPPEVSIGSLLDAGTSAALTRPWLFFIPAGVLVALLLGISLLGDALRDAIDPTSEANRG